MEIIINIPRRFVGNKTIKRTIPQTWYDIPDPQTRLNCLRLVSLLTKEEAAAGVLPLLLDIPKRTFLAFTADDVFVLSEKIAWIFDEIGTTPLITEFEHEGETYHLPKKDFANGTAFEFAMADDAYNEWSDNTKAAAPLIRLVAILCREAKRKQIDIERTGDIRIELNTEYEATARAERLELLDFGVVLAVLRYFQAIKKLVHESGIALGIFERPMPKPDNVEEKPDEALFGWWTTFRNIAKTGVMGNEEQVWRVNFWRLFAFLQEEKKRADDAEREIKKASKNY